MAEPIILVALGDPEQKPRLFACQTCGRCQSVKHQPEEQARRFAAECTQCHPKQYICDMCGVDTPQYWTRCHVCVDTARIEAATEIEDDGGPYFGFGGEQMYHELDEARLDGHDWVQPCTIAYPRIDAENVLEHVTEDMFEDASVDDLEGVDDLCAAIQLFNDRQTTKTYWGDAKRKIRVPPLPDEVEPQ